MNRFCLLVVCWLCERLVGQKATDRINLSRFGHIEVLDCVQIQGRHEMLRKLDDLRF